MAALSITTKIKNQPRCPRIDEDIIYTEWNITQLQGIINLSVLIKLEDITLCEVKRKKNPYVLICVKCNINI